MQWLFATEFMLAVDCEQESPRAGQQSNWRRCDQMLFGIGCRFDSMSNLLKSQATLQARDFSMDFFQ
ncbi:hypothetical protein BGP83_14540 [Pseudomonas putida]|nr:hypothetical protein BGP83_14540 [Pseudomonas putida]